MNTPNTVTYTDPDTDHDRAVNSALDRMWLAAKAGNQYEAQKHWKDAVKMISERSPEHIERMEAARGLT